MAKITPQGNATRQDFPAWIGDYLNREHNLPGGVTLDMAQFPAGTYPNGVPAGTLVGRTNAEVDAGAKFGPAADADDEVFLTLRTVQQGANGETEVYRRGSIVKNKYLATWAGASVALKAKLRAVYQVVPGY